MIPKGELEDLLRNRLKEALPPEKIDYLFSEIKSLGEGWEEASVGHRDMGHSISVICWLADQVYQGAAIKLYWKKKVPASNEGQIFPSSSIKKIKTPSFRGLWKKGAARVEKRQL